jgi:hypothetical protein
VADEQNVPQTAPVDVTGAQPDSAPAPFSAIGTNVTNRVTATEQPTEATDGVTRVPQVLQGFSYSNGEDLDLWLTPSSPNSEVQKVPMEILEQHAKTGYVRFVSVPQTR